MDGSTLETVAKDRPFDPSRVAGTPISRQLVAEVSERLISIEHRQRVRQLPDQERYDRQLAALVCDLAHRYLFHGSAWITVEMSKVELAPAKRRAPFLTEKFRDLITTLAAPEVDLIELNKGYREAFGRKRSTIRAGTWLTRRIDELELTSDDLGCDPALKGDPLLLKSHKNNGKAVALELPKTEEVESLRLEMDEVNLWIAQANLGWIGDELTDGIDLGSRYLVRIFNNASLQFGGRLFHGFWMNLSKQARRDYLLIDDRQIVSLDFAQMGVSVAYAMVGQSAPDGDHYLISGYGPARRTGIKRILNALLSADSTLTRFPAGTRSLFPRSIKFQDVLKAISQRHPALVPLFGSSRALELQYIESQVILRALAILRDKGVVALPVHDCLLVADVHETLGSDAMKKAFTEVVKTECEVEVERSATVSASVDHPSVLS